MSKTKALFAVAMGVALPIAIQTVAVSAAQITPPPTVPAPQVTPLDATFPLLIDAGSTQTYTDSQGRTWRADQGFIGGTAADRGAAEIGGTTDDRIYQTERWGLSGYTAKVPNGKYTVRLHFAETFLDAAGKRVFSVKVEDRTIANLDVFAEAGGKNKALVKTLDDVSISDGELNIDFTGASALVNGVEVAAVLPPAPPAITIDGGLIKENAAAGEHVATVLAKRAANETFTYSLVDDAQGRFVIDSRTGEVTVAAGAVLDFEAAASHDIEVAATDARGAATKQRFTISVLDVNEIIPGLTLTHLLPENAAAGTPVGVVAPVDPSITKPLFSLKDDAGGRFVIDTNTGIIRVAANASLDFETTPKLALTAVADAGAGRATDQPLEVSLADVNEPPTVLFMNSQAVQDAVPAGTVVGTASAVDADVNETFTYSLIDNAQGRFVRCCLE